MADETHAPESEPKRLLPLHPDTDHDVPLDWIIGFVGGLAVLLVVSAAAGWLLYTGLRDRLVRRDPPPPPLIEARSPVEPPSPRLQSDVIGDMARFRAHEQAVLGSYGAADRRTGTARIPIERAMQLMVERGTQPARTSDGTGQGQRDGGAP